MKWDASDEFLQKNELDGREIQLVFTAKTPLQKETSIDNQATATFDNISKDTNVVTIGVDVNLPLVTIPKTGSNRLRHYQIQVNLQGILHKHVIVPKCFDYHIVSLRYDQDYFSNQS